MAKILVVDDVDEVRDTIKYVLMSEDHEIVDCGDGAEAIEALKEQSFDLIVTDIVMPNTDGIELIEYIKSNKAETPVLAISGGGMASKEQVLEYTSYFADSVLGKPFKKAELLGAVNALLNNESIDHLYDLS